MQKLPKNVETRSQRLLDYEQSLFSVVLRLQPWFLAASPLDARARVCTPLTKSEEKTETARSLRDCLITLTETKFVGYGFWSFFSVHLITFVHMREVD